jgi:signal transduction histidine kinase
MTEIARPTPVTQRTNIRLPACFAAFPGAVLHLASDGTVLESNGRIERELGRAIVGQSFGSVLDTASCGEKWERVLAGAGEPNAKSTYELMLDGSGTASEPRRFSVLRDDDADVIWVIEHPIDPHLGDVQQQFSEVNSELAGAHRALVRERGRLDEFAHAISHDLKAPLRSVANYARWIEEDVGDALTGEARAHMELLRSQVERMRRMIDGVLEYARSGRTREASEWVDTAAIIADVLALLAPPPTCQVEVDANMPILRTERAPLQQVFLNLVGNAIRHARRDDAHVRVGATDLDSAYDFFVRDNGPGIAPRAQEKIWGLFHTLTPRSTGGDGEGTGIGLAIVRQLVEMQGGRAWVESEEGKGATFHFLWPKGAVSLEDEHRTPAAASHVS